MRKSELFQWSLRPLFSCKISPLTLSYELKTRQLKNTRIDSNRFDKYVTHPHLFFATFYYPFVCHVTFFQVHILKTNINFVRAFIQIFLQFFIVSIMNFGLFESRKENILLNMCLFSHLLFTQHRSLWLFFEDHVILFERELTSCRQIILEVSSKEVTTS